MFLLCLGCAVLKLVCVIDQNVVNTFPQVCEVEVEKFSHDPANPEGVPLLGSGRSVIRSCIAKVPPGYPRVEITQMTDQIWGVDGFDT
jgi:hypothetical protein